MMFIIIYVSAVTTYRVAFTVEKQSLDEYQRIIDITGEVFFGIDIILSFFTGYLDPETGKFITSLRRIAKKY